jgi:hypothetical protein
MRDKQRQTTIQHLETVYRALGPGPIRPTTGLRCSTNVRAPSRTASARVVAKVEVPVPRGVAQITSAAPAVTPTAAASPSGGPVCMRGVEGARCGRGVRPDDGDYDGIVPSSTHCERPAKQTGGEHVRVARDGGPCEGARELSAQVASGKLLLARESRVEVLHPARRDGKLGWQGWLVTDLWWALTSAVAAAGESPPPKAPTFSGGSRKISSAERRRRRAHASRSRNRPLRLTRGRRRPPRCRAVEPSSPASFWSAPACIATEAHAMG